MSDLCTKGLDGPGICTSPSRGHKTIRAQRSTVSRTCSFPSGPSFITRGRQRADAVGLHVAALVWANKPGAARIAQSRTSADGSDPSL